jgi:hypothetical protein
VWLLGFFNPAFLHPKDCFAVIDRFLVSLVGLREKQKRILFKWMGSVSIHLCVVFVKIFVERFLKWCLIDACMLSSSLWLAQCLIMQRSKRRQREQLFWTNFESAEKGWRRISFTIRCFRRPSICHTNSSSSDKVQILLQKEKRVLIDHLLKVRQSFLGFVIRSFWMPQQRRSLWRFLSSSISCSFRCLRCAELICWKMPWRKCIK